MMPAKRICYCGRVEVHRVGPKCQFPRPWRINPRWRKWQAGVIRRRYSNGATSDALSREFGIRVVARALFFHGGGR